MPSVFELSAASGDQLGMVKTLEKARLEACARGPSQTSAPYLVEFDRKASDEATIAGVQTSSAVMKIPGGTSLGWQKGAKPQPKSTHIINKELDRTERPGDIPLQ